MKSVQYKAEWFNTRCDLSQVPNATLCDILRTTFTLDQLAQVQASIPPQLRKYHLAPTMVYTLRNRSFKDLYPYSSIPRVRLGQIASVWELTFHDGTVLTNGSFTQPPQGVLSTSPAAQANGSHSSVQPDKMDQLFTIMQSISLTISDIKQRQEILESQAEQDKSLSSIGSFEEVELDYSPFNNTDKINSSEVSINQAGSWFLDTYTVLAYPQSQHIKMHETFQSRFGSNYMSDELEHRIKETEAHKADLISQAKASQFSINTQPPKIPITEDLPINNDQLFSHKNSHFKHKAIWTTPKCPNNATQCE